MIAAAISRPDFRWLSALPLALLITLSLLYLMHQLVFSDAMPPDDALPLTIDDVVYLPKEIITEYEEKPVKPPAPIEQPQPLPFEAPEIDKMVTAAGPGFGKPIMAGGDGGTKVTLSTGGALVKRVMVPPVYPQRLLARGVEGYVDLQFDVTEYGATKNIIVLRSEPESAFDSAAIKAVERWRYRPAMADGMPVASNNVRERIRFTIEQ